MSTYYKIIDSSHLNVDTESVDTIQAIGKRTTNTDWSAIYLQTTIEHALNYLEHKAYQTSHKYLLLIKFSTDLTNILVEDNIFANGQISGEEKAKILKKQFGLCDELLLMDNISKPLMLLDNDSEYELIVPHHLFNKENFKMEILKTYIIQTTEKFGMIFKTIKEMS